MILTKYTACVLALALAVIGAVIVGPQTAASAEPVVTPSSGPSAGGTAISIPLPPMELASQFLAAGSVGYGLTDSGQVWWAPLGAGGEVTWIGTGGTPIVRLADARDDVALGVDANGQVWTFTADGTPPGGPYPVPASSQIRVQAADAVGLSNTGRLWRTGQGGFEYIDLQVGKPITQFAIGSDSVLALADDGTLWNIKSFFSDGVAGLSGITAIYGDGLRFFVLAGTTTTIFYAPTMARATMATGHTWVDFDSSGTTAAGLDSAGQVWKFAISGLTTTTASQLTAFTGSTSVAVGGSTVYGIGSDQRVWRDSGSFTGAGATASYTSVDANGGVALVETAGTARTASGATLNAVTTSATISSVSVILVGTGGGPSLPATSATYSALTGEVHAVTAADPRINGGPADVIVRTTLTGGAIGPQLSLPGGFVYEGQPLPNLNVFAGANGVIDGHWYFTFSGLTPGNLITATDADGATWTGTVDALGNARVEPAREAKGPVNFVQSLPSGLRASAPWAATLRKPNYVPREIRPVNLAQPGVGGWTVTLDGWQGQTFHVVDHVGATWDVEIPASLITTLTLPETVVGPVRFTSAFGPTAGASFYQTSASLLITPAPVVTAGQRYSTFYGFSGSYATTTMTGYQIATRASQPAANISYRDVAANGNWSAVLWDTDTGPLSMWLVSPLNYSSGDRTRPREWSAVTVASPPSAAAIDLTMSVNTSGLSAPPRAGDPLTYTFTATNTGTEALTGVQVVPTAPGMSGVTYTWPAAAGSLAPQQSVTGTAIYTVTQADIDAGVFATSAAASGTSPSSAHVSSATRSTTTTLAAAPALGFTLGDADLSGLTQPPAAGQWVEYPVTITNDGNVTLTGVGLGGALSGAVLDVVWPGSAGVLTPGGSATGVVRYPVSAADVSALRVAGTETVRAVPAGGGSVTSVPATIDAVIGIAPPTAAVVLGPTLDSWLASGMGVPGAVVTVTDTASHAVTATVAGNGTWSLVIPSGAVGPVAVTQSKDGFVSAPVPVTLPPAPAPVALMSVVGPDATGRWQITGTAEDGATITVTDDVDRVTTVPVVGGVWSAVLPPETVGPLSVVETIGAYTSPALPVTLPVSMLELTASADASGLSAAPLPGEPITFSFVLSNPGETTLTNASIASSIPGLVIDYVWPGVPGVLAPGETATASATVSITQADIDARGLAATMTASAANPAGGPVGAPTAATSTPIAALVGLTVSATSDISGLSSPPQVGDLVAFQFEVVNTGTASLETVDLVSSLPGISPLSGSWPGAVGALAPGQHVTLTGTYPLTEADIAAHAITAPQVVTARGAALDGTPVSSAAVSVDTPLGPPPQPVVTLLAGPGAAGEWRVEGTGLEGADVVISDADGVVATATVENGTWSATIPAGALAPFAIVQRLGSVGSPEVEVSALPVTGATLDLDIDDTGLSSPPAAGDTVTITVRITNTGTVPLTGVGVSTTLAGWGDLVLSGWSGAPGTLAPGEVVSASVDYTLTQDDIDGGQLAGSATLRGSGPFGNLVVAPAAPVIMPVAVETAASLSLEGRVNGNLATEAPGITIPVGGDIEWTVTVTNTGTATLHEVGATTDEPSVARFSSGGAVATGFAAGLLPPAGFSGTLAPGESVEFQGTGTAIEGTHGLLAAVTARVGTVLVAGSPMMVSGQARMFYSAPSVATPPPGPSAPQALASTGLDLSPSLALAAGLAGLGVSALLMAAARRRSSGPWITRVHRAQRDRWWRLPH